VIPVEVTQAPWHFTTVPDALDHWQALIAGLVALLAAVIAVGVPDWRARTALRASLASEVRLYVDLLIQTREILRRFSGPEKLMLARDLRSVAVFNPATVYPASADRVGLLGPLAVSVTSFYANIERLNFTARFLTHDPEELVPRENIENIVRLVEQACRTSLPLLSELPFDDRDADFRAKIATWASTAPPEP
jgi:hypothetical protein